MKIAGIIATLAGLVLGTGLVAYYGFGAVAAGLLAVGWLGFAAVCALHVGVLGLLGLAWYVVLLPRRRPGVWAFAWGRTIRDAGGDVLPLTAMGGFVMGARAVTLLGVPMALAFAATIIDVTLELVGQIAYTALGLLLLVSYRPDTSLAYPALLGLVVAIAVTGAFVVAQRGGFGLVQRMAGKLASRLLPAAIVHASSVQDAIHDLYRRRRGLQLGAALHLMAWIGAGVEAWLTLRFLGHPLDLGAVLAIESLLYATRAAAFVVPSGIGVQEGAYVVLGGLFGLDPQTALALSIVRRGRDLVFGVPALLSWQAVESRRLLRPLPTADAVPESPVAKAEPAQQN
jgi:glycosyltransferase 2 family protein